MPRKCGDGETNEAGVRDIPRTTARHRSSARVTHGYSIASLRVLSPDLDVWADAGA